MNCLMKKKRQKKGNKMKERKIFFYESVISTFTCDKQVYFYLYVYPNIYMNWHKFSLLIWLLSNAKKH